MQQILLHRAVGLLGLAALLVPAAGHACSLAPMASVAVKQMMAREIGHRLGLVSHPFPLEAISTPEMHAPLGLDALCHGLGAFHYSAGFRFAEAWRIGPGPVLPPAAQPGARAAGNGAEPDRDPGRWPPYAQCSYEGVAVVLGFGESSPVAVHFRKHCS